MTSNFFNTQILNVKFQAFFGDYRNHTKKIQNLIYKTSSGGQVNELFVAVFYR